MFSRATASILSAGKISVTEIFLSFNCTSLTILKGTEFKCNGGYSATRCHRTDEITIIQMRVTIVTINLSPVKRAT